MISPSGINSVTGSVCPAAMKPVRGGVTEEDSECNAAIYRSNRAAIEASADNTHTHTHTHTHTPSPLIPELVSKSTTPQTSLIRIYTLIKPPRSPHYSFSPISSNKSRPHATCGPLLTGIQSPCWHRPASHLADSLPAGKEAEGII